MSRDYYEILGVPKNADKKEIKKPTKGKEVGREEYQDIVKKKMEEMRAMFRARRGGGRR